MRDLAARQTEAAVDVAALNRMVAAGRQLAQARHLVYFAERPFRRPPSGIQRGNDPEIAGAHPREQSVRGCAEFWINMRRVERRRLGDVTVRVDDFESC